MQADREMIIDAILSTYPREELIPFLVNAKLGSIMSYGEFSWDRHIVNNVWPTEILIALYQENKRER